MVRSSAVFKPCKHCCMTLLKVSSNHSIVWEVGVGKLIPWEDGDHTTFTSWFSKPSHACHMPACNMYLKRLWSGENRWWNSHLTPWRHGRDGDNTKCATGSVVVGNQALQKVWLPSDALTIAICSLLGAIGNTEVRWPADWSLFTYQNGGREHQCAGYAPHGHHFTACTLGIDLFFFKIAQQQLKSLIQQHLQLLML